MSKTKQEVIKALELCADPEGRCDGCPYENGGGICVSRAMRDAAELLKETNGGRAEDCGAEEREG